MAVGKAMVATFTSLIQCVVCSYMTKGPLFSALKKKELIA